MASLCRSYDDEFLDRWFGSHHWPRSVPFFFLGVAKKTECPDHQLMPFVANPVFLWALYFALLCLVFRPPLSRAPLPSLSVPSRTVPVTRGGPPSAVCAAAGQGSHRAMKYRRPALADRTAQMANAAAIRCLTVWRTVCVCVCVCVCVFFFFLL